MGIFICLAPIAITTGDCFAFGQSRRMGLFSLGFSVQRLHYIILPCSLRCWDRGSSVSKEDQAHLSSIHESALEFLCGRWTCARNAILGKKIPFRYRGLYQIKPLWLFRSGWERAGQEHAPVTSTIIKWHSVTVKKSHRDRARSQKLEQ